MPLTPGFSKPNKTTRSDRQNPPPRVSHNRGTKLNPHSLQQGTKHHNDRQMQPQQNKPLPPFLAKPVPFAQNCSAWNNLGAGRNPAQRDQSPDPVSSSAQNPPCFRALKNAFAPQHAHPNTWFPLDEHITPGSLDTRASASVPSPALGGSTPNEPRTTISTE